tara:strand:- start:5725 stop:6456 length:732 start_codon:yes stop_codon:yes gene_type:complete
MDQENFIKSKQTAIIPVTVLVGYKIVEGQTGDRSYFTHHRVINEEVKAGTPLTKRTLSQMLRLVDPTAIDESCEVEWDNWLDHRILSLKWTETDKRVMWVEEAKYVHMNFKDSLGLLSGQPMGVPPTLFYIKNGSLSVYCIKSSKDIKPGTPIMDAPYFNTKGSVCIGTGFKGINFRNRNDITETIQNFSAMFWGSKFSEVHSNTYSKDIIPLYKELLGKQKPFPTHLLNDLGFTIQDILNKN